MNTLSRRSLLGLLALPAACTIEPLAPLRRQVLAAPAGIPVVRPAALGQRWTYQKRNPYNSNLLATEEEEVVSVSPRIVLRRRNGEQTLPDEVHSLWGQQLRDTAWDMVQNYETALPLWPADLRVGAAQNWDAHYTLDNNSFRFAISAQSRVMAWEKLVLPAGEFNTLRIEKFIRIQHADFSRLETIRRDTIWLAPEIGRWVARETSGEYRGSGRRGSMMREDSFRWELTAWR